MKKLSTIILATIIAGNAFAFTGDLSINQSDISFSNRNFLEGAGNRIYASVSNNSSLDLLGVVKFYSGDAQIGSDQAISVFAGKTDGVFVDWTPQKGSQTISVKIFPWDSEQDNPANNSISTEIFVAGDLDRDGTPDGSDPDIDGDGHLNEEDEFPRNPNEYLDTDGDGIGNNADPDDDNDDVPDESDEMPLDPLESIDTDGDGIGNMADTDDDNDGLSDDEEDKLKTNPLLADTDGDGVNDKEDAFPLDPNEQIDTDKDGIGNNTDLDDDNDGIPDEEDQFPLNKAPIVKLNNQYRTVDLFDLKTLDATGSSDPDGNIQSYNWEINGQKFTGEKVNYKFAQKGTNTVKLEITDDAGQTSYKYFQINVQNLTLYKFIIAFILSVLLAIGFYFKYISPAKNQSKS